MISAQLRVRQISNHPADKRRSHGVLNKARFDARYGERPGMKPVIDPRRGDVEDDASSTKRRSLLSLAGSLLAEISFPKLILSWTMLFVVPGLLLGLAPLIASAWVTMVSRKIASPLLGIWPALLLVTLLAIGFFGARALFRMAENNFWSLNSLAVEPVYVACREGLRHLVEKLLQSRLDESQLAALRAGTAGAAGIVIFAIALAVIMAFWPSTRWLGNVADLVSPRELILVALANSIVLVTAYLAVAALVWALADATMPRLRRFWSVSRASGHEPVLAGRPLVGYSCGRRAVWLSDRERPSGSARKSSPVSAARQVGCDPRG